MILLSQVVSDLMSTSRHQSWSSDNLPVLLFSYFSCSFGLAIFTCVFEFDMYFLFLKACHRNTGSVGQVQYSAKLMKDYYEELSSEPHGGPVRQCMCSCVPLERKTNLSFCIFGDFSYLCLV